MFVTAQLALGEQTLPAVPEAAVRADGTLQPRVRRGGRPPGGPPGAGGRAARTAQVPILSGLKAGEQVVAELTPDVRDGARVK